MQSDVEEFGERSQCSIRNICASTVADADYDCDEEAAAQECLAGRAQPRRKKRSWCQSAFSHERLTRRVPALSWMKSYNFENLMFDFIAGVTVAFTAIPQGIAYGAVAGLPVQFGLYTAFVGPFVYTIFGSVPKMTVGPTAVMAIMTLEYTSKGGAPYAIMLCFLAGCLELLLGLLNLGFLIDFISGPVISGFCSAAALSVIVVQFFKGVLGLSFKGSTFLRVMRGIFHHDGGVRTWDAVLGLNFIVILLILKNLPALTQRLKSMCSTCCTNRFVEETLWFISTCRNALAVVLGCIIAYIFECYGFRPFTLTGEIKSGIPAFQFPQFTYEREVTPMVPYNSTSNWTDIVANETAETVTFDVILKDLGAGIGLVPIIAILEQVAIAKAFSCGRKTDSSQEMIALGLGSIIGSFFGSFPLTASFSRSSVMSSSGARTQFANFFNGAVILLALGLLMPTFSYIPNCVLGAVIITSVYTMIEFHEVIPLWKARRVELIPLSTTFCCCLFINMEYGILIGAQLHLLLLAYEASRPKTALLQPVGVHAEQIVLRFDRSLYFASTEVVRNCLNKAVRAHNLSSGRIIALVIDMTHVAQIDYTALKMLKSVLVEFCRKGNTCSLLNVNEDLITIVSTMLPDPIKIHARPLAAAAASTPTTTAAADIVNAPYNLDNGAESDSVTDIQSD